MAESTHINGIEAVIFDMQWPPVLWGESEASPVEAIGKLAAGLGVEMTDLFRFSGHKAVPADPHLSELLALLEKEGASVRQLALELVKTALRWRGK